MTATDEQITAMTRAFNNASERLPTLWSLSAEWNKLLSLLEDPESDQDAIQLELQRVAGDMRATFGRRALAWPSCCKDWIGWPTGSVQKASG